ncbi:MAG TPA: LPS-assembly protein LptD [Rhodospirillaceae bacterium]|nr:LPS-assembly protein LptD [Rhodospirillaceae bacterium]
MSSLLFRTLAAFLLAIVWALPGLAEQPSLKAGRTTDGPSGKAKPNKERPDAQPVLMTADQIVHDRDLDIVMARGHVELDQGGRILLADSLSYNMKQDVIIATGNASLTDIDGQVLFADYFELTGDMKEAAAKGIRVLMVDDSRIVANSGRRLAGDRSVFDMGVYTACNPCAEDISKPPLWQIKASRVIHDELAHRIEYEDAWLDVGGWPVAYTPYFSHADPTIRRESGLLPFSVLNNKVIGTGVRTPYFQVIDPYQDVTVSPMVTSNDDQMLAITDRLRTSNGEAKTTVSIANLSSQGYGGNATTGWNIDARAQFNLDQRWRAGYEIERASDQNYLPSFGYHIAQPYLTTRPYLEGFSYRNYAAVEGYSFQSLTTPVLPVGALPPQKSPIVLPLATYNFVGEPSSNGSYWSFNTHAANISRGQGTDSRRVNTDSSWNLPFTAADGEVYKLTTSLRADAYNSNNLTPQNSSQVDAARAIPEAALTWRYPFSRINEHSSETLSPIIMASASPYGGNSLKIPNEDSLDFELDDSNIFNPSPSSGYDRVVTGPRVAYGTQYTYVNRGLGAADLLLAQSYQVKPQTVLPQGTGLDKTLSDVVGHTDFSPSANVNFHYGFRVDESSLRMRRSEVATSLGPPALNLQSSYVFYDRLNASSPFYAREQLNTTLSTKLSRYWLAQIYQVENLGNGASPLQSGMRIIYEDECLLFSGDAGSLHTTSQTFATGHYFMLRIYLKTLAQFPVDLF